MLERTKLIYKLINGKPLSVNDKITLLKLEKTPKEVLKYIKEKVKNLYFIIDNEYEGTTLDLMRDNHLEGWCWQTTEAIIIFFNDDDYIERGILKFDKTTPIYYHSWICFKYNNKEYIFDPCLSVICERHKYHRAFEIKIEGTVTAKKVKKEIIKYLKNNEETKIKPESGINSPLFANDSTYKPLIIDGQIKKLIVMHNDR